ncbi:MAG TPA: NAD-dependent dehydratase, partial [Solibacterales bacterium]|nr:NAD-dependent dehydratase [Bryobacterales bacterium]
IVPGDGGRLMQFVYIRDLVEACVKALTETNVIGHAFNIGNERPITQLELVQALARAGNKKPQIARVPRERIIESGGNPMGDPAYFGHYLDVPPITEAIGKVKRMLKLTPTPFDEGLKETYRWYLRNFKSPRLKSDFEDKLIALGAESSGLLHSRI